MLKLIFTVQCLIFIVFHSSQGIVFQDDSQPKTHQAIPTLKNSRRATVHEKKIGAQSFVRNELYEAVYIADVERVYRLLQQDPEILSSRPPIIPDRIDQEEGRSALLVCGLDPQSTDKTKVDNDCAEIAKLLHGAGANMSIVDFHGWDALAMGAVRGYSRYCKYLLKYAHVDPNHFDHEHVTALMKAAGHAHFGAFQVLMKYGADLSIQDNSGLTALHYAAKLALTNASYIPFLKKVVEVVPRLLLDVPDTNNRTCLMYAAINNNMPIVKLLLEFGSDPRLQDKFYVSIPTMTSDYNIRSHMLEAIAVRVEQEHSSWLNKHDFDYELDLEVNSKGDVTAT
jgi:hypothetical protein